MWEWFRAAYDKQDVSLFRVLPVSDEGDFMRFVYPLRRRAAGFFALLLIVYELVNTFIAALAQQQGYSGLDAFNLALRLFIDLGLLCSALWGSPSFLSKVVHSWYGLIIVVRILQISSYAFLGEEISLSGLSAYAFYVLLLDMATGTTLHLFFPVLFWLTAVETAFIAVAIYYCTPDESGLGLNRSTTIGLVIGFFVIVLWTVHTVQYNTVMMYVWNQKYQNERIQKDSQRRLEELHRLHLANTLHDIGCPLQAFVNGLDDIQDYITKLQPDGKLDRHMSDVLASMEASVTLMSLARRRAILYAKSFNRVDALLPNREYIHLQYLIGECLKVIKVFARSYNSEVPIYCNIEDDVPEVIMADSDWLIEALTNYLSNAIKFTQSGSIQLNVCLKRAPPIHPQDEGGGTSSMSAAGIPRAFHENTKVEDITFVHFEVRDTGRGVPQESVDKLFQPFSQLQSDVAGTGLGLLSVRTKIELLHGAVGVEPNVPEGSVFWFDIPLDVDIPPPLPEDAMEMKSFKSRISSPTGQPGAAFPSNEASPQQRRVASPEEIIQEYNIDTSQIKLLLVEDEKMLMRFSSKKFAELGFNVTEATDGAQALELMRSQPFDVVLMDQNMPQLGGLESIRRFREWQRRAIRRSSSYRADVEGARSEHRDSHTASFSVASEEALLHRPSETDARTGAADEPPEHSPLIFMMSGSILDADKQEADELCVLDFFEKPLHVSLVAAKVLSSIVQHPTRLDRVRRQSTASTR